MVCLATTAHICHPARPCISLLTDSAPLPLWKPRQHLLETIIAMPGKQTLAKHIFGVVLSPYYAVTKCPGRNCGADNSFCTLPPLALATKSRTHTGCRDTIRHARTRMHAPRRPTRSHDHLNAAWGPSRRRLDSHARLTRSFWLAVGCRYQYATRRNAPPSHPSTVGPDSSFERLRLALRASAASPLPRTTLATPAHTHDHLVSSRRRGLRVAPRRARFRRRQA